MIKTWQQQEIDELRQALAQPDEVLAEREAIRARGEQEQTR